MTRFLADLGIILIGVLVISSSGCGASSSESARLPTGPTPSSSLTISPTSVTLTVGMSQVFTANGGDGFNYVWTPVEPSDSFSSDVLITAPPNQMRVTMVRRPALPSTRVEVQGVVNGQLVSATATINTASPSPAPPGSSVLTPLPCSQEPSLRSLEAITLSSIEFVNNRSESVRIHWLDYQGRRQLWLTLNAGQSLVQGAYVTHPWVVANTTDRCLGIYLPAQQGARAIIQ